LALLRWLISLFVLFAKKAACWHIAGEVHSPRYMKKTTWFWRGFQAKSEQTPYRFLHSISIRLQI
jgi:hypothetical protein